MKDEIILNKYDSWNKIKKSLEFSNSTEKIYFKERDVWWCSLGLNIGSESFGKGSSFRRPILIVKKLSADLCIAIPLTTKKKDGTWFIDISLNNEMRYMMLYQIRTLHKRRFQHKIGELSNVDFIRVKEKLDDLLELSLNHHPTKAGIEGNIPKVVIVYSDEELKSMELYNEYLKFFSNS